MRNLIVLLLGMVAVSALFAGCTQQQSSQATVPTPSQGGLTTQTTTPAALPDTVTRVTTNLGSVLADSKGLTLYTVATDTPGDMKSTCTGTCLDTWPAASAGAIRVSPPLIASDFSIFTRDDGKSQVSYRGFPLYYYRGDTGSGAVGGDGVGKVWFAAKPDSSVMVAIRPSTGSYLTDGTGMTLYFFTSDTGGTSSCTGSCIATWPPFSVSAVVTPSLLNPGDFTTVSRSDGNKQSAFRGRPLYYYAADKKPGDTLGNGINNRWFVANISGLVPLTPTPTSTVTPVITPYSRSYGSGY